MPEHLATIHTLGAKTRYKAVRADMAEAAAWLADEPVCDQLLRHQIIHAGEMNAHHPFQVVRLRQSGTFFMACVAGEGEILVDGVWKRIQAGNGCLLPPRYPNAIRAAPGKPWHFYWVRYLEPDTMVPVATATSPMTGPFKGRAMAFAIEGLREATAGDANPSLMHHWVELVHQYVLSFAGPRQHDNRLWRAWEVVQGRLDAAWDLDGISSQASMSPEHFRRMCQKHLGRSPMKHLTFLRIQRATDLLVGTDQTLDLIARSVGYNTASSFSKAYHKWTGSSPSQLRGE